MSTFATPVVAWRGSQDPTAPLVVLLHGRGSHEEDIVRLADLLPEGNAYAAVRAPIAEGGGFAWFANRGIGRPLAESLADTIGWFRSWLEDTAAPDRPVLLAGFSGGATFAGGVALADPHRIAGLATMYATLPYDAGLPVEAQRLDGLPVLVIQGESDQVIPTELLRASWDYLHQDSGAEVTGRRSPGGHALTAEDVAMLGTWIADQVG